MLEKFFLKKDIPSVKASLAATALILLIIVGFIEILKFSVEAF